MTVNQLIKKLEELKRRDLDNGDIPVVIGETLMDEVYLEHFEADQRLPYARLCSVKYERLQPTHFGRFL